MATTERVDKNWQQRELTAYSTEAILGTLKHYGVSTDERAFTELAGKQYPVAIAHAWHDSWKGTGQFSRFPIAAAEELWHRLLPGQLAPVDLALALIALLKSLDEALGDKPDDGTRETRFKVVEAYLAKLPPSPSERRDAFEVEVMLALGDDWVEVLDSMGAALAQKKKRVEADRLTAVEESLFPVRVGSARALMRAAAGETAEAKADLDALAADATRPADVKIAVVDAYTDLGHFTEALALTQSLVAQAGAEKDLDRLRSLVDRVTRLAKELPPEDGKKLVKAFEQALVGMGGSASAE